MCRGSQGDAHRAQALNKPIDPFVLLLEWKGGYLYLLRGSPGLVLWGGGRVVPSGIFPHWVTGFPASRLFSFSLLPLPLFKVFHLFFSETSHFLSFSSPHVVNLYLGSSACAATKTTEDKERQYLLVVPESFYKTTLVCHMKSCDPVFDTECGDYSVLI